MTVEAFLHTDLPSLGELQPPGWRDITLAFDYYLSEAHCRPVKVVSDGRMVAVGCAITFRETGWIGHIIVHPEFRRRRIGMTVVNDSIEFLRASGCDTISLVATEDGYPVYLKAGFVPQTEYVFFERPEPPVSVPIPPDLRRIADSDMTEILRIDQEVTGEDRRALYAEVSPETLVCLDADTISGFYRPDLGEGFVAALNADAGRRLFAARIAGSSRVALPVENTDGIDQAGRAGFSEKRRSVRMVLGPPFGWRPECIYSRIGGNLG
jgi:GNAT superfamily N-acetyltransferase